MKKLLALILALVMCLSLAACGGGNSTSSENTGDAAAADDSAETAETAQAPETGDTAETAETTEPAAAADVKVGMICVHDENSGYDAAHISGLKAACEALGISADNLIIKTGIPEDETCYDTAVDLAEQGCTIIFSDSYGHQDHMLRAAEEYPEIIFVAATGDKANQAGLDNYKNIFTWVYESRYVSGVVAGMKLKEMMDNGTVTDPHIGYVGAFPYAEVVSGYTAFFLGIRSIVPEAYMDVQYTNSWYDPSAEGAAADALIARGCVIIGQHADSTGAPSNIQAAKDAGANVYSVGYNIDMLAAAPTAALTSAQNNWAVIYQNTLESFLAGNVPTDFAAGYADGAVMISALGPEVAEGTAEKVAEVEAAIADGSLKVFDCSTFTVNGENPTSILIDMDGDFAGETEGVVDGVFQESVLRSAPGFAERIDGITELTNEG